MVAINNIKFTVVFSGGPFDKQLINVCLPGGGFYIGMPLNFEESSYIIADGPAAKVMEKTQEGNPHLCPMAIYNGPCIPQN